MTFFIVTAMNVSIITLNYIMKLEQCIITKLKINADDLCVILLTLLAVTETSTPAAGNWKMFNTCFEFRFTYVN
jgi:hypothetical protein